MNRLWPELAGTGLFLANTPENAVTLAQEFQDRFLGVLPSAPFSLPLGVEVELAAGYDRYSDAGSNPRSLPQQLKLKLERARQNNHFIAWRFVNADAAVTGTTDHRRGYQLAKEAMTDQSLPITTLYIDEIGRASRDAIEALSLGKLVQEHEKRLIGVSDGFDSTSPYAKMMLHLYAMMQEWFIDQLRAKVNRGMDDAFDLGANIGRLALGYKLVPMIDKNGNRVFGRDGAPLNMLAIDDGPSGTKRIVEKAFNLYTIKGRSPQFIAKYLNRLRLRDWGTWTRSRVIKLLRRLLYHGVGTYRMSRHEFVKKVTPEGVRTVRTTKNFPKTKWRYREAKHLQIIPDELWERTQERLDRASEAYRKKREGRAAVRRDEVYPRLLLTNVCGICGHVMYQSSKGKYTTCYCPNGVGHKKECTNRGYKSIAAIEDAVLQPLLGNVLSDATRADLVQRANDYVIELAKAPAEDVSPLNDELAAVSRRLDRLYDLVEESGKQKGAGKRIAELERRQEELQREVKDASARNSPLPAPLTAESIKPYLDRIRELLQSDVATAAPIIRQLIGDVRIYPTGRKAGNRNVWEARFAVSLLPALVEISGGKELPTTSTFEFLHRRSWEFAMEIVVEVDKMPKYELLAERFRAMHAQGMSINLTAAAMKMAWCEAKICFDFAIQGKRPDWVRRPKKNHSSSRSRSRSYKEIAIEVSHRHDELKHSFEKIAKELGKSVGTIVRAYEKHIPS